MRIEVLTVPECPNGPLVEQRLAEALAGRPDVRVERRVAGTAAQAEEYGMRGSPTVLIDGRDPFAGPGDAASLSCRLYRDEQGRVQGAPSTGQLRAALAEADCCGGEAPAAAAVGRGGRGRRAPAEGGQRAVHQAVLRAFAETGRAPDAAVLEELAAPSGVSARAVLAALAAGDFLTLDEDGQVDAAYPFSARPTGIEVTLPSGVTVASMCAIDALGIAAMLGSDTVIDSADPVSGEPVRVTFAGGTARWQPEGTVVFYGARAGSGPSAAVCCGYLRFFATRENAEAFAARHPEAPGRILGQQDAGALGEEIFGPLLATDR
jgi:predicted DsbA family dithiol-disulfide isomerase